MKNNMLDEINTLRLQRDFRVNRWQTIALIAALSLEYLFMLWVIFRR
jgi:hypothetical protein